MNTRISSFGLSLGAIITSLILSTSLCKAQVRSTLFFDKDSVRHKAQVDEIIKKMTLREKVAQLFVISISRNPSAKTRASQDSLIRDYGVGNIIIMRGPIHEFMERANYLQKLARYPLLVATDAEWGAAMRFYEYLPYPRQAQLARIEKGAEKLLYKMGRNVGKELLDLNIYVNYAPVADVAPANLETFSQRAFSHDPKQISALANAYMRGMQDEGIYACAKHYPGHGGSSVDTHYEMPVLTQTRAYMDSVDLYPYTTMFANGLEMVMIGHYSVPSIDPSGNPTSISGILMNDVLRRDQGFKGVVITDAIAMKGLTNSKRGPIEAVLGVYKAGADMILMPEKPAKCIEAITEKLEKGEWSVAELDKKVYNVLMLKARAGFFEKGFNPEVKNLDRKIAAARKRDYRLIKRMQRKMLKSSKPYIAPTGDDRTLILDRAGK